MSDQSEALLDAVQRAVAQGQPLQITGSGSKSFLVREALAPDAALLSLSEHRGVVDYRPEELVLTARSGTPLRELGALLDQHEQMLPFDPPQFAGAGTLGGAVACGLSGPGRPWLGAVRDRVLGVELINGLGERLRFGGQVMKNVAGFDVSRLQAGAFGTLGVLLNISVSLLPKPAVQQSCEFALEAPAALQRMREWARSSLPISGLCFVEGALKVRLAGAEPAVAAAVTQLGAEPLGAQIEFWSALRDQELAGLRQRQLLRVCVPPAAALPLDGAVVDWGGALRWFGTSQEAADVAAQAAAAGGSAQSFDGHFGERTQGLSPALASYHRRLKHAFDPNELFNPGLLHADAN